MARGILWMAAIVMAALALVAGCFKMDVPQGPYVVMGNGSKPPSPRETQQAGQMDRQTLEQEYLRLSSENERLRQEVDRLKRDNKALDQQKDRLEDRVEELEDQVKKLRSR